jgi:hypothetical protein
LDECMGFGGDDWCIGLAGERDELQTKWSIQWEDEEVHDWPVHPSTSLVYAALTNGSYSRE